jgi:hypothetical protein
MTETAFAHTNLISSRLYLDGLKVHKVEKFFNEQFSRWVCSGMDDPKGKLRFVHV